MSSVVLKLLAIILRALSGGLLEKVLAILRQRSDVEVAQARLRTDVAIQTITAEQAARLAARDVVVAEQQRWWTASIRPLFALPLLIWWWAVIADSIFLFRWNVAALPKPLDEWAGWIMLAYFLAAPFDRRRP